MNASTRDIVPGRPNRGANPRLTFTLALVSLIILLVAASCNSGSSPTNPYGGGGGGTTGGGGGGAGSLFNFGPFGLGQSAQRTFATTGTFGYHCTTHQAMGMVGSVQVDPAGVDSALVQIGASGLTFAPPTAHIKPGGYVRWVNASGLTNHTVTSN